MLVLVLLDLGFLEKWNTPIWVTIGLILLALIVVMVVIPLVSDKSTNFALGKLQFSIDGNDKESSVSNESLEQRVSQIEAKLIEDAKKLELLFDQLGEMPGFKDKVDIIQEELNQYNMEIYAWLDVGRWLAKNKKRLAIQAVKKVATLPEHKSYINRKDKKNLISTYSILLDHIEYNFKHLVSFDKKKTTKYIGKNITLKGRPTTLLPQLFKFTREHIDSQSKKENLALKAKAKEELSDTLKAFEEHIMSFLSS